MSNPKDRVLAHVGGSPHAKVQRAVQNQAFHLMDLVAALDVTAEAGHQHSSYAKRPAI